MKTATIVKDTWAKQSTVNASMLAEEFKFPLKAGETLEYSEWKYKGAGHISVKLPQKPLGFESWLVFDAHVDFPDEPKQLIRMDQATHIFGRTPTDAQLKDLNDCLFRFQINTPPRMRHFMSQIAHESGGLRWLKEQDQGWYIPENFGLPAIAGSDGGYKYRGAGMIQLSLPDNYRAFASFMNDWRIYDEGCPYVAAVYPATSAGFWWHNNRMNALCDRGASVEQVTRRVNGGLNGIDDRIYYYQRACEVI